MAWASEYRVLLWWLTGAAVAMIATTLAVGPLLIARIPADYFTHEHRPRGQNARGRGAGRMAVRVGVNVVGWVLVLGGIAMLALPGQGVLTLVLGLFLVEFPGKYRVERWIVSRAGVLRALNWVREKRGAEPLVVGERRERRRSRWKKSTSPRWWTV